MFRSSLTENHRESAKSREISGPKPGDYELGSLESRAAARAMHDAQPIEESCKVLLICKRPDGEVVRVFTGKGGQVLKTEAQRGEEWVRVDNDPKPLRVTTSQLPARKCY
jgi:hypothetical protein